MQELLNIIDSRMNKKSSNDMSLKSAPCKVIEVFDNNNAKVRLISNGAEYVVGNFSGSQVQVGETVQLFYKGMINQNSAYIGASLYKGNDSNGDNIDHSVKNIMMDVQTGQFNSASAITRIRISASRPTDLTIYLNMIIKPTGTMALGDRFISIFIDGVEQPFKPSVYLYETNYVSRSLSIPISIGKGIHTIQVNTAYGYIDIQSGYAYITGQYIEEYTTLIYGYRVTKTNQSSYTNVYYLEDAVGMTPAKMGATSFDYGSWEGAFFMPKPCMLKYDGTVAYYLDPNDYTKKIDGTPSDVGNPDFEGNAMMEWGQIWYKFINGEGNSDEGYFYVSNKRVDESYHCLCNYNSKDEITPHFYTAIYNSTLHDGRFRSLSGFALTQENGSGYTTGEQEVTYCTANNTKSDVEWYTDVYADRVLINALLVLIGKSLNTHVTFGRGMDRGNENAKKAYTTGTLNDKGLFYGITADGNSNGEFGVKVFGMENWWGCVGHRTAGLVPDVRAREFKVKLTYGTADGSTATGYNSTGDGYVAMGTVPSSSNGCISNLKYNEYGFVPLAIGAVRNTRYGDYYTYYSSGGTPYLIMGGYSGGYGDYAGAFCFILDRPFSSSGWIVSTTLSCKPIA